MIVLPMDIFLSGVEGKPDDLVILANSFEKRCIAFASKLERQPQRYKAQSVTLLTYSDRGDRLVRQKCNANFRSIERVGKDLSLTGNVYQLYLEPYEVLPAIRNFRNLFSSIANQSSVVVDISTIPKIHLIYLIDEAFNSNRVSILRLVYTRARYGKYDALSWGAEEPVILPKFGKPRFSEPGKSCLVLFCGLEPERSYSIWRRFGQDRCIRFFIDSGEDDFDRPTSRAIRFSNFDEREPPIILPAFRPEEVLLKIWSVYQECKQNGEHLFIAPLTTKWEACAVWEFFHELGNDADASIVYCAPGRFNASGYTVDEFGDLLLTVLARISSDSCELSDSAKRLSGFRQSVKHFVSCQVY